MICRSTVFAVLRPCMRRQLAFSHLYIGGSSQVARGTPEYFFPSEQVIQQRDAADSLYIICRGVLEEVAVGREGSEEVVLDLYEGNVRDVIPVYPYQQHMT